jgi:hypothetical protein
MVLESTWYPIVLAVQTSFRDLIGRWPSIAEFARAIEVKYQAARKMRLRNNVDSGHWPALLAAAKKRGIRISADALVEMSARRKGASKKALEMRGAFLRRRRRR